MQLGMLGNERLREERRSLRIEARAEPVGEHLDHGRGNVAAVLAAALGLGVAENFAGFILGAEYQAAFIFALLVAILVWRRFWLARERRYLR